MSTPTSAHLGVAEKVMIYRLLFTKELEFQVLDIVRFHYQISNALL
jgi:hypothetical protein